MLPAIMTGVEYVSRRRKSDMSSRIDSVGSVMFEIQDILAKGQILAAAAAFTDVTLVLKNKQPPVAHSVILSATRPFFRMFLR